MVYRAQNQSKQPPKTYGPNKHQQHESTTRVTTNNLSAGKLKEKKSGNHCYTRYSRNKMMLPLRINIFCCKTTIKPSGESPKIVNLCSKPLTERQINLLRRRLKFTPTPKPNTIELKSDIKEFSRKLLVNFSALKTRKLPRNKRNS